MINIYACSFRVVPFIIYAIINSVRTLAIITVEIARAVCDIFHGIVFRAFTPIRNYMT